MKIRNSVKHLLIASATFLSIGTLALGVGVTYAAYVKQKVVMNKEATLEVSSKGSRDTHLTFNVVFGTGNNWYSSGDANIEVHFSNANDYTSLAYASLKYAKTGTPFPITYNIDYYKTSYTYIFVQRTNPANGYYVWGRSKIAAFSYDPKKVPTITIAGQDTSGDKDPWGQYFWNITVEWKTPEEE